MLIYITYEKFEEDFIYKIEEMIFQLFFNNKILKVIFNFETYTIKECS